MMTCTARSPESLAKCRLEDTAEAHQAGHEGRDRYAPDVTVSWSTSDDEKRRWVLIDIATEAVGHWAAVHAVDALAVPLGLGRGGATPDGRLTADQVADRVGVSRMTIYRLINSGDLPAVFVGKRRWVTEADLTAYLSTRRTPTTEETA